MTLLMGVLTAVDGESDAEPVLVALEGSHVLLTLDDGSSLALDVDELEAAIRALAFDTETAA